ncbi:MAG: NAD-dependent epimerase/dehydratase family protein [Cyanobacteria bacterium P01_A01_bin.135]
MKTLVTGANGFTGSHLVSALLGRGHSAVGFVRATSDLSRLQPYQAGDLTLAYGDITDQAALTQAMVGVDWVFHTAAYVELGVVDAERMARVNVEGTQAVLAAAQAAGVSRLLYCSTIGVYGDTQGRVIDETFARQQQDFSSAYDRTKYEAQQRVDQAVAAGLHTVSVMPSGIFGPDDPHFGPVLDAFRRGKLKVWAGGDRVTGIVHVDDLVQGMLLAIEQGAPGEHFILSADEMTTREMFATLSQMTGVPEPAEVPPPIVRAAGALLDPVGRLLNWQPPISQERVHYIYDRCVRVDGAKAKQQLGWQPRSVEDTLQDCITHRPTVGQA